MKFTAEINVRELAKKLAVSNSESDCLTLIRALAKNMPFTHGKIINALLSDALELSNADPLKGAIPKFVELDPEERVFHRIRNNKPRFPTRLPVKEYFDLMDPDGMEQPAPKEVPKLTISEHPAVNDTALLQRFRKVICARMNIEGEKYDTLVVTGDEDLTDVLGMDSLDQMEVIMACEDEFAVEIPDAEAMKMLTRNAVLVWLHNRKA